MFVLQRCNWWCFVSEAFYRFGLSWLVFEIRTILWTLVFVNMSYKFALRQKWIGKSYENWRFYLCPKSGYVFILKKMCQDLSHNLYFEIFFSCFWRFLSKSNKTGNPGRSEEIQSSSSGSIKRALSLFLWSDRGRNSDPPPSLTFIIFSWPPLSQFSLDPPFPPPSPPWAKKW